MRIVSLSDENLDEFDEEDLRAERRLRKRKDEKENEFLNAHEGVFEDPDEIDDLIKEMGLDD